MSSARVLLLALALAEAAAVFLPHRVAHAAPTPRFGAAYYVDPASIVDRYNESRKWPSPAFDGQHYLVVWEENVHLYALRIGPDAKSLDAQPLDLGNGTTSVTLFAKGTYYVFARVGATPSLRRVSASGELLDKAPTRVPTEWGESTDFDAAFDGEGLHAVWTAHPVIDGGLEQRIVSARFGLDGKLLSTAPVQIAAYGVFADAPSIACTPSAGCLVVWDEKSGTERLVYAARLSQQGAVLSAQPIQLGSGHSAERPQPVVTSDGEKFLVAWHYNKFEISPIVMGISALLITPSGDGLTTTPIDVAKTEGYPGRKEVIFDGLDYVLVWNEMGDVQGYTLFAARISRTGQASGRVAVTPNERSASLPRLATAGDGSGLLAYTDELDFGLAPVMHFWAPAQDDAADCVRNDQCSSGSCSAGKCAMATCSGAVCAACKQDGDCPFDQACRLRQCLARDALLPDGGIRPDAGLLRDAGAPSDANVSADARAPMDGATDGAGDETEAEGENSDGSPTADEDAEDGAAARKRSGCSVNQPSADRLALGWLSVALGAALIGRRKLRRRTP